MSDVPADAPFFEKGDRIFFPNQNVTGTVEGFDADTQEVFWVSDTGGGAMTPAAHLLHLADANVDPNGKFDPADVPSETFTVIRVIWKPNTQRFEHGQEILTLLPGGIWQDGRGETWTRISLAAHITDLSVVAIPVTDIVLD